MKILIVIPQQTVKDNKLMMIFVSWLLPLSDFFKISIHIQVFVFAHSMFQNFLHYICNRTTFFNFLDTMSLCLCTCRLMLAKKLFIKWMMTYLCLRIFLTCKNRICCWCNFCFKISFLMNIFDFEFEKLIYFIFAL